MASSLALSSAIGCPACMLGRVSFGILSAAICTGGTAPAAPLFNQMSQFFDVTGDINFYTTGIGTRDVDTNTTPTFIFVSDLTLPPYNATGATVLSAYLYWNILASHTVTADTIIFDGVGPLTGTLVGWCDDTCWAPFNNGFNTDSATPPTNIFNRVYRYSLPASGPGSIPLIGGTFQVELPGISTNASSATASSDSAHYPGCNGSQGVALLITFSDGTTRRIIAHDGAVLVTDPSSPFPSYSSYSIGINPGYFTKDAVIANAAGDAQTKYADNLLWNGVPFATNIDSSYFNPNAGNLLFVGAGAGVDGKESVTTGGKTTLKNCPNVVTVDTSGVECLDWFLFVYAAENNECCDAAPNPGAPYNQLNQFKNIIGEVSYKAKGTGTRDIDMATAGISASITYPGTVVDAYIYWNVFASNSNLATFDKVDFNSFNVLGDTGTLIGWGDNSCWTACDPGNGAPTTCETIDPIKNRVYRLDIGPNGLGYIFGGGPFTYNYTVKLPGAILNPDICTACPNTPHFPGCAGTQGVLVVVIYENLGVKSNLIIYDGCAVVIPTGSPYQTQLPGPTMPSYSVAFSTLYNVNANITAVVGDSQDTLQDKFSWNGKNIPGIGGSYFNSTLGVEPAGNLLSGKSEDVKAGCYSNIATVSTTDDCLSWFFFAYIAQECTSAIAKYCGQPVIANNNRHFISP